jgi:uncharacterized membrane protein
MAKKEEKHLNAKQKAFQEKQARKGEAIVKWIFGILIGLAIIWMIYSSILVGV